MVVCDLAYVLITITRPLAIAPVHRILPSKMDCVCPEKVKHRGCLTRIKRVELIKSLSLNRVWTEPANPRRLPSRIGLEATGRDFSASQPRLLDPPEGSIPA
jgi:hypothetical protein